MTAKVVEVKDPVLGRRYAVDCPWCGLTGRYVSREDAELVLSRRHRECLRIAVSERGDR
jgi:hypothetical protein